jgi:nucleoside-diphosphate-sugar epimerase
MAMDPTLGHVPDQSQPDPPEIQGALAPCTLIVLGAGGYLGREITRHFHGRRGFRVVGVFRRRPFTAPCDEIVVRDAFASDLRDLVPDQGRVILLNAAFGFGKVGKGKLDEKHPFLEAAVLAVMKTPSGTCINISSMSAFPNCSSAYGEEKLFVEKLFSRHRGINIRPGLVVSWERPGAAFQRLLDIVGKHRVVPVLTAAGDGFFICDLDLLILGIEKIVGMSLKKSHTISFCYARRIRLVDLLRMIGSRLTRRPILVPVPWRMAYWMVLMKERIAGTTKIRADSILDFAFPATFAPHRQFYARLACDFWARQHSHSPADSGQAEFSSLEPTRRGALTAQRLD